MAEPKRKLTAVEKRARREWKKKSKTVLFLDNVEA